MGQSGPLSDPALQEIEHRLDHGDLEGAQQGLAGLGGSVEVHGDAVAYLSTRMLYKRGRLESEQVAERLRDLLDRCAEFFPQARAMLDAAERRELDAHWSYAEWTRMHGVPEPPSAAAPAPVPQPQPQPENEPESDPFSEPDHPVPKPPEPPRSLSPPPAPPSAPSSDAAGAFEQDLDAPRPPSLPSDAGVDPSGKRPSDISDLSMPRAHLDEAIAASAALRAKAEGAAAESGPPSGPESGVPLDLGRLEPPRTPPGPPSLEGLEAPRVADPLEADISGAPQPPLDSYSNLEAPEVPGARAGHSIDVSFSSQPSSALSGQSEPRRPETPAVEVEFESMPSDIDSYDRSAGPTEERRFERSPSGPLRHPEIPRAGRVPAFSERAGEPSYVPAKRVSSERARRKPPPRSLRQPSTLPPSAGRYSETPAAPEVVESYRPKQSSRPPPVSSEPPGRSARRPTTEPPDPRRAAPEVAGAIDEAPRIKSGIPEGPDSAGRPSLFEIAAMVDQGRYQSAMEALDTLGNESTPDHVLMRARALDGLEDRRGAIQLIGRLAEAPLLDPELRAGAARLLIEMGDLQAAFDQAEQAYEDDPTPELVRLTYAWAALRTARRFERRTSLVKEADEILRSIRISHGPHSALVQSLKAWIAAEVDDPKRAISMAQRALGAAPRSADALAAVVLASARLGRASDTEQAWIELLDVAHGEADALSGRIEKLGLSLSHLDPAGGGQLDAERIWDPVELDAAAGNAANVVAALDRAFERRFDRLGDTDAGRELPVLATIAANLLTTLPIFRCFAPYDLSLWSIERIDAALTVACGQSPQPTLERPDSLEIFLGAYVGESLREAHGGRWKGTVATAFDATVVAGSGQWFPTRLIDARIRDGAEAAVPRAAGTSVTHPGTPPWAHRLHNPEAPPAPWGRATWPTAAAMPALGRALTRSPVATYCSRRFGVELDRTFGSLEALDGYLDLVAHPAAPAEPDAPWAPLVASLLGAYVGETLRATLGGEWRDDGDAEGSARLRIDFPGGASARPVSHISKRIEDRATTTLSDYCAEVRSRVEVSS